MDVIFWGSRGSTPAPLNGHSIREKVRSALTKAVAHGLDQESDLDRFIDEKLAFEDRSTFGGNTPCVELRLQERSLIFDMGSGLREFGKHCLKDPTSLTVNLDYSGFCLLQSVPAPR